MSYPEQAPAGRPGVVRLAVTVLVVMALGALGYAVAGLTMLGGTLDRFRAAATGTSADGSQIDAMAALLLTSIVLSAVVSVLAGLLLAGLALGLAARRPAARVATWVVAGFGVLLGCCASVTLFVQRVTPLDFGDDQAAAELAELAGDAYPLWWIPLTATLSVAQVLGYLVVAVLLALPSANAWFRRPSAPAPLSYQPGGPPPAPPYHPYPPPGAPQPPPYPPR
ncbi:hypothetical protein E0H26_22155 [Micromonospora zingiberis]|uniref:Uncharacterized protein n=1 Tax=Micromonospora zingiberis TaxID=2053011 RepID=A0A4R0GE87_9ACTN|nr:hypothetical protein [Micromonospora zingiberis]TCB93471.1 hypothetical protein E0H26_22155 [Micromonospora zingiberis]